jgi:fructose-specific phosphotransferase system IIC component
MRNVVLASLLVVAILAGAVAGYSASVVNQHTSTVTSTVLSQFPVTFLGAPKGCVVEGFCINSTLVNHLGSNITVIMSAWLRNATTGQNVTTGRNSVAYAVCTVDARKPSACVVVDFSLGGTYEVTLTVLAFDGKTMLSPTLTAKVTD